MFTSDNESVRERICDFRKMGKVTQQDLAIYLNIKRGSYQFREAKGDFKWEEIELIAEFFGVSPYFIKYGAEEEELRTLAKMLKDRGGVRQPAYTVFDDLSEQVETTKLYSSFLALNLEDQKRIIRYIDSKNY